MDEQPETPTRDDADKERLRRAALEGAVDEDGDIAWFVSPRELRTRKAREEADPSG